MSMFADRNLVSLVFAVLLLTAGCGASSGGSGNDKDGTSPDTQDLDTTVFADVSPQDTVDADELDTKDPTDTPDGTTSDTTTADTAVIDTAPDVEDVSGHGAVTTVTVEPPDFTLEVINGGGVPKTFEARATYADGFSELVSAQWTFDRFELAAVDRNTGVVSPTGSLGGAGTLTATKNGISGTATVRVRLHYDDNSAGLTQLEIGAFATPDATASGVLLYPYDETVFARGILAPELMWEGGAAGDRYRVQIRQDYTELSAYIVADPPSSYLMDPSVWTRLTESNQGEPVSVEVQRLGADGQAHAVMGETWTIAQGSLRGTIYYWAINRGGLMRIDPGASAPVPIFDSGPATDLGSPAPANYDGTVPPWTENSAHQKCVSCHTVNRNGTAIAAVFERKENPASAWGLIDLTQATPTLLAISDYNDNTIFVGLNPDARYAAVNKSNFRMQLINNLTGAVVPSAFDGFTDSIADPSFSPDGRRIAFSSNVTGGYPVEFWRADLDVMDFDQASATLSNRRMVANGGTEAIAFPSFTPDSDWVVYQKGDYSRAKYGPGPAFLHGVDDLYITDVAGVVGEQGLDAANGVGVLPANNAHLNYEPRVNPIAVGGYAWVVFVSPRDYGHKMRATSDPTNENRKQLWVTAVDLNPQPGVDPSHPAFWLPGQVLSDANMSGYWTLEACHATGLTCEAGYECCTGFCQPNGSGEPVCVPPTGSCSNDGEACTLSSDCCGNGTMMCFSGFCSQVPN